MKNLLIFFATFILFSSCIFNPSYLEKNYIINNNSSLSVQFSLINYDNTVYSLAPAELLTKHMYGNPKLSFVGNPRVTYVSGNTICKINDMPFWTVVFYNSGSKKIHISEKNNMFGNFGENIVINAQESISGKIFTKSPVFSLSYEDNAMPVSNVKAEWVDDVYKVTMD